MDASWEDVLPTYSEYPGVAVARQIIQLIEDHDEKNCHLCNGWNPPENEDTAVMSLSRGNMEDDPSGTGERPEQGPCA